MIPDETAFHNEPSFCAGIFIDKSFSLQFDFFCTKNNHIYSFYAYYGLIEY